LRLGGGGSLCGLWVVVEHMAKFKVDFSALAMLIAHGVANGVTWHPPTGTTQRNSYLCHQFTLHRHRQR
jgi:hypothetical protein